MSVCIKKKKEIRATLIPLNLAIDSEKIEARRNVSNILSVGGR